MPVLLESWMNNGLSLFSPVQSERPYTILYGLRTSSASVLLDTPLGLANNASPQQSLLIYV